MFHRHTEIQRVAKPQGSTADQELQSCDMCDKGWDSETELQIHRIASHRDQITDMFMNMKSKPVCFMCLTTFKNRHELICHTKKEHLLSSETAIRIEREIFVCDNCSQIFFNKKLLIIHLAIVHKAVPKGRKYQCPKCPKNLRTENNALWSHFEYHRFQSVAICPICLTKCKSRKHLQEHLTQHPSYYFCDPCAYSTKSEQRYNDHLALHHENIAPIKDDSDLANYPLEGRYFIPRIFHSRWDYNKVNVFRGLRIPLDVRMQICVLCREILTTQKQMREHIANHNLPVARKPSSYECACGEKFVNNILLKHHIFKLKGDHVAL